MPKGSRTLRTSCQWEQSLAQKSAFFSQCKPTVTWRCMSGGVFDGAGTWRSLFGLEANVFLRWVSLKLSHLFSFHLRGTKRVPSKESS